MTDTHTKHPRALEEDARAVFSGCAQLPPLPPLPSATSATLGSFFPIFFFDFRQFYRKLSRLTVQKKFASPATSATLRYLRFGSGGSCAQPLEIRPTGTTEISYMLYAITRLRLCSGAAFASPVGFCCCCCCCYCCCCCCCCGGAPECRVRPMWDIEGVASTRCSRGPGSAAGEERRE